MRVRIADQSSSDGVPENQLLKQFTFWNELFAENFEIGAALRASLFCGVERRAH